MRLVEEMAFAYCGGLEEVDLPTNIDSIEEGLFADCGSLTPITIPKKVDRMGTGTFHNCYDLMEINMQCLLFLSIVMAFILNMRVV